MFLYVCLYECVYVYIHMSVAAHRGPEMGNTFSGSGLRGSCELVDCNNTQDLWQSSKSSEIPSHLSSSSSSFYLWQLILKIMFFLEYFVTVHNILFFFIKIRFVFRKTGRRLISLIVPRSSFRNIWASSSLMAAVEERDEGRGFWRTRSQKLRCNGYIHHPAADNLLTGIHLSKPVMLRTLKYVFYLNYASIILFFSKWHQVCNKQLSSKSKNWVWWDFFFLSWIDFSCHSYNRFLK